MKCPKCGEALTGDVKNSHPSVDMIRRLRKCLVCGNEVTTYERFASDDIFAVDVEDTRRELAKVKAELQETRMDFIRYIDEAKAACRPHGVSGQPVADIIREMRLTLLDPTYSETCDCFALQKRWNVKTGMCDTCHRWCTLQAAANYQRARAAHAGGDEIDLSTD